MSDQWDRIRNNGNNQFDMMRARANDDQLRRINNAQNLFNRRVDGAQNGFNALGDAIGGIFDSSPAPKPKSSSNDGLGLFVAGAAIAGGAYLLSKLIDSFKTNMTLEKISDAVSPRLDDTIKKYEENGLRYSAGKFIIKYADEKHFQLEFEMYFRDADGKWHKCYDESDLRDADLLEEGAWKTIQDLKVIKFPIEKPK